MATSEDSPVAMKLKKMWLKTPVGEEQAAQAVLDPAIGTLKFYPSNFKMGLILMLKIVFLKTVGKADVYMINIQYKITIKHKMLIAKFIVFFYFSCTRGR